MLKIKLAFVLTLVLLNPVMSNLTQSKETLKLNLKLANEAWTFARSQVNDAWEALRKAQALEEHLAKEIEAIHEALDSLKD